MLRNSKSAVSMTSVYFGIVKVQRQKLNLNEYFFSIRSTNLFFMHNFRVRKLKFKYLIDDIVIGR